MAGRDDAQDRQQAAEPRNKAEIIARTIRQEIVAGTFAVGSRLPSEADLIERFGVSRPSFREALRILESERLITVTRGAKGGAIVRTPDLEPIARGIGVLLQLQGASILDIFRARSLIEPELVRSIAATPDDNLLAALAQCAAAQRFRLTDLVEYKQEELNFRRLIIDHGSSVTLSNLAALLNDVIEHNLLALPPVEQTETTGSELRRGIRAKERLISLIEKRKVDEAEAAWRNYINEYAERIMARIDLRAHRLPPAGRQA